MGRRKCYMVYLRPFCYYCDKHFKNEVFLHQHQKSKHFICNICPKKFSSIDSMLQHFKSVHKQQVEKQGLYECRVPNANQGHENVGLKIFGMQGVPRMDVESWIMKGAQKYWGKIIDKRNEKLRNEMKQKRKEEQENERQMEVQKPAAKEEDLDEIDPTKPISFELKM